MNLKWILYRVQFSPDCGAMVSRARFLGVGGIASPRWRFFFIGPTNTMTLRACKERLPQRTTGERSFPPNKQSLDDIIPVWV